MMLVWLDLETTGLSPEKDVILELTCSLATLNDPFYNPEKEIPVISSWVFGLSEKSARNLSPFIIDMHTKNGLLAECERAVKCVVDAEETLLRIIPEVEDKDERPTLAGSSVHFDLAFIRVHMPRLAKRLSHRVYDVSAIKLFCRSLGMPKPPKGPEPHRAREDVLASIQAARECSEWLRSQGMSVEWKACQGTPGAASWGRCQKRKGHETPCTYDPDNRDIDGLDIEGLR